MERDVTPKLMGEIIVIHETQLKESWEAVN